MLYNVCTYELRESTTQKIVSKEKSQETIYTHSDHIYKQKNIF